MAFLLSMLCVSQTALRPTYKLIEGEFITEWHNLSSDGQNVLCDDSRTNSEQLINLSSIVGVVCYGAVIDGVFTVFDFSCSHLCRMQFLRLKNEIIRKRLANVEGRS